MALAIALLVMLMASPLGFVNAQNPINWTLGKDYTSYSTQSFKSGSTLEFDYDKTAHNVLVVSKSDYDSCNAKNPIQTFSDGKSVITLKQGAMYFICGFPGHCSGGMKLQVNVGESGPTPASPTTPAPPTPTGSGSTPTTPAAPSPKDSSAAAGLSGAGHLMVGVSLVFGAFFALV
ncbi:uclacyanin-2-like [Silene latifolia]|uniref:uclacyanin-2-like n=1 Tax=Silene latifolia TaxID=37657 RepID=UPI003D787C08